MSQVVIENPVINSPFAEPTRHFRFGDEGITNDIVDGRRSISCFVPIARPRKKGGQLAFETEWIQERIQENQLINDIRGRVAQWRRNGYPGVTPATARLLAYWTNPDRGKKLFFCQIEALETLIYLTEVAQRSGDAWIANALREGNDQSNPGLPRAALKMATSSGKTAVMAMLIAWHTLNKAACPQDARFCNSFLVVTPGIIIRDRLRVLLPDDPQNYYRQPPMSGLADREFIKQAGEVGLLVGQGQTAQVLRNLCYQVYGELDAVAKETMQRKEVKPQYGERKSEFAGSPEWQELIPNVRRLFGVKFLPRRMLRSAAILRWRMRRRAARSWIFFCRPRPAPDAPAAGLSLRESADGPAAGRAGCPSGSPAPTTDLPITD